MILDNMSQIYELTLPKLQYFFSDEKIARVVLYLFYVLFVICIFLNVALFWKYAKWEPLVVTYIDTSEVKSLEVSDIAQKHIFGVPSKAGATLASARETKLPIKLKGVVVPLNPKLGSAILLVDNKEQSYKVGDIITVGGNKVTLEYVFKDKIFISNNDSLEYVLYPKLEDRLKNSADAPSPLFDESLIKFKGSDKNNFPRGDDKMGEDIENIEDGNDEGQGDKPRNIQKDQEILKTGKRDKKEILSKLKKRLKNNYT